MFRELRRKKQALAMEECQRIFGHKIDAIARNEKASFCVIGQEQVMPEKSTTRYKSVTVFGKIRVIGDDNEKRNASEKLTLKYYTRGRRPNTAGDRQLLETSVYAGSVHRSYERKMHK